MYRNIHRYTCERDSTRSGQEWGCENMSINRFRTEMIPPLHLAPFYTILLLLTVTISHTLYYSYHPTTISPPDSFLTSLPSTIYWLLTPSKWSRSTVATHGHQHALWYSFLLLFYSSTSICIFNSFVHQNSKENPVMPYKKTLQCDDNLG